MEYPEQTTVGDLVPVDAPFSGRFAGLAAPAPPPAASPALRGPLESLAGNRWAVIGLLLTVGPIGLPLLWFSPRFSKFGKISISTVFLLATSVLPLVVAWYFLDIGVRPLLHAFEQVNKP